jgi:alpha/beta superfamily hydrolase
MITVTSRPFAAAARRLRSVELNGPAGHLEGVVNEAPASARYAAVICHPHPLGGGTLHNKVVYHAMKALNAPEWGLGWPVLRFNFRGTGLSQGMHHGVSEAGDVLAAMHWLENEYKLPLVVVGFSFGAAMALTACCGQGNTPPYRVHALAALGLPIRSAARSYDYSFLQNCMVPKFFLSGDRDQFAPKTELIQALAYAAEPKDMALVPGADHFFTGHVKAMQSALSRWLKEYLE